MATRLWLVKKFRPAMIDLARETVAEILRKHPGVSWGDVLVTAGYHLERRRQSGNRGLGRYSLNRAVDLLVSGRSRFDRGPNTENYREAVRRVLVGLFEVSDDTPAGILRDMWIDRYENGTE